MDAGDDEPPVLLGRAARATRGKRITKLLEDEVEQDEAFWNQDALKDEENDDNYVEEQDVGDEFDSDFGQGNLILTMSRRRKNVRATHVPCVLITMLVDFIMWTRYEFPSHVPTQLLPSRLPVKKRLMFPGKTLRKTNVKKFKVTPKLEDDAEADKSADKPSSSAQADVPDELEAEKTIRKSTRTPVTVRQAEREDIRAEKEAMTMPIKRRKEGERMTQEEMLLEATEIDIMNLRNLECVLAREEEVNKKDVVHMDTYEGPTVRFFSRDGDSRLDFINGATFGSEVSTTSSPCSHKPRYVSQAKYCLYYLNVQSKHANISSTKHLMPKKRTLLANTCS